MKVRAEPLLFVVLGILVGYVALTIFRDIPTDLVPAEATLVAVEQEGRLPKPVVEFTDDRGLRHRTTLNRLSGSFQLGDRVKIVYSLADPTIVAESFSYQYLVVGFLFLGSLVLLSIALLSTTGPTTSPVERAFE